MALKFRVAKRIQSIGKRKGKELYYAIQEEHQRTTWSDVERRIVHSTGISRADLRGVVIALSEIIEDELKAGRSVDLAEIGTIKLVGTGKMMDRFEDVNASTIKKVKAQFYRKKGLTRAIEDVRIEVLKEAHIPKAKAAKAPSTGAPSRPEVPSDSESSGDTFDGH